MWRLRSMGWGVLAAALLALFCLTRHARASEPPTRVSVLTMGPGDHPFTRFGHNAILLEWPRASTPRGLVYNFGTFQFDGLRGVRDFMSGRFRYWLSVTSLEDTLQTYAAMGRSLSAQELELTRAERQRLFEALTFNARPDHRYYAYDYYRDNCSTRVRDTLDELLHGELQRGTGGPGTLTLRQHTLAMVGDTPWLYFGLDIALGSPTDRPTTRWEELFLPRELHDTLARATREFEGQRVPLVRSERRLLDALRPPVPRTSRLPVLPFAAAGVTLGAYFGALGLGARRRRAWRILLGLSTALLGAGLGLLGTALVWFWASKHWATHANPSLLACPPWSLALGVLGLGLARGTPSVTRPLLKVLGASLITSSLLPLVSLTATGYASLPLALLFIPLWAGWWWGVRVAARPS